jgi:hypothetical protein
VNAVKFIEMMLSGSEVNHPGEYKLTPKEASAKRKKYTAKYTLLFFLNLLFWTTKKVMIERIDNTKTILIIIHEKSHNEGLINWFISRIDILL